MHGSSEADDLLVPIVYYALTRTEKVVYAFYIHGIFRRTPGASMPPVTMTARQHSAKRVYTVSSLAI
jgi:hypothetical protein